MKTSTVIALFLGTIKAQDLPDYLFGNNGEMTTYTGDGCATEDPAGQTQE